MPTLHATADDIRTGRRTPLDVLEECLANIERWDTGSWSRYDLFPHRVTNVASKAYHELHVAQLEAMDELAPHPELRAAAERFAGYAASPVRRAGAFGRKALFRMTEPRSARLARLLPWASEVSR